MVSRKSILLLSVLFLLIAGVIYKISHSPKQLLTDFPSQNTQNNTNSSIILVLAQTSDQNVSLISANVFINSQYKGVNEPPVDMSTYVLEEYSGSKVMLSKRFVLTPVGEYLNVDKEDGKQIQTELKSNPYSAPRMVLEVPLYENARFRVREIKTGKVTELSDAIINEAKKKPKRVEANEKVTMVFGNENNNVLGLNSDNDGYLDLLVLSSRFTDQAAFNTTVDFVSNTILATEPYKSYKDKIRIKRIFTTQDMGCGPTTKYHLICDAVKVKAVAAQTTYNDILVIDKSDYASGITEWGTYSVVFNRIDVGPAVRADRIAVHELGHLIGWLADEYELAGSPTYTTGTIGPNCDPDPKCPRWANISGTSCIQSCSFVNAYRSTYDSVMKTTSTGEYNTVSRIALEKELNTYTAITPSPTPPIVQLEGNVYCTDPTTKAKQYAGLYDIKITSNGSTWTLAESDVSGKWRASIRADVINGSIKPDGTSLYPYASIPDTVSGKANGITCTDSNVESAKVNNINTPTTVVEGDQCKRTLTLNTLNFNLGYCAQVIRATLTPEPAPITHVDVKSDTGVPLAISSPGFISNACWGYYFQPGSISTDKSSTGSVSGFDAPRTADWGYGDHCGVMIKPPNTNYRVVGVTPVPATDFTDAGTMKAPQLSNAEGWVFGWPVLNWNTGVKKVTVVLSSVIPTATPVPTGTPHTWNIKLQPVCTSGAISTATYTASYMDSSSGRGWQNSTTGPGAQTIRIFTDKPYQIAEYVRLLTQAGTPLNLTGTPPNSYIYYDATGTQSGVPSAAWYNTTLVDGTYTINFVAPLADCTSATPTRTVNSLMEIEAENTATPIPPTPTPTVILTTNLAPTADTFIDSGSSSSNYGTNSLLKVKSTQTTFMKFDLKALAGKTIVSATLRMYPTNVSTGNLTVKTIANTTWSETGLTYSNKPSLTALQTISFTGATINIWKDINIMSLVQAQIGKDMTVIISTSSTDNAEFSSRNASSNKPVLIITYK